MTQPTVTPPDPASATLRSIEHPLSPQFASRHHPLLGAIYWLQSPDLNYAIVISKL